MKFPVVFLYIILEFVYARRFGGEVSMRIPVPTAIRVEYLATKSGHKSGHAVLVFKTAL